MFVDVIISIIKHYIIIFENVKFLKLKVNNFHDGWKWMLIDEFHFRTTNQSTWITMWSILFSRIIHIFIRKLKSPKPKKDNTPHRYNVPLVGARDLQKVEVTWFPIHVLKIMCQNWDPTSWKSHPKSFQISILETASVKIQASKLRSQVLKTMSWKSYPKIAQVFLGLGNPECKLQVSKNWGSHVLKIMSKKFPGLGLGNPHHVHPKTKISHVENHVLKNFMFKFCWTPPQVQANSRWPKTETVKNSTRNGQWKNLPSTTHTNRHCCFNI